MTIDPKIFKTTEPFYDIKDRHIIPKYAIQQEYIYIITSFPQKYIITKYRVYIEHESNRRVISSALLLDGKHPNCDSFTNVFCLNETDKLPFGLNGLLTLESLFSIYNFDHHFKHRENWLKNLKLESPFLSVSFDPIERKKNDDVIEGNN